MTPRELARASHSYGLVLVLIIATIAWTAGAGNSEWAVAVIVLLQGTTVLVAFRTSEASLRVRRIALVAVGISVVAALLSLVGSREVFDGTAGIVTALLVAVTPVVIVRGVVRQIREERAVRLQSVFGALCVYLLIGLFFAVVYSVVAALGDQPFFASGTDGTRQERLYFSFVTQTTVGYGDFTAGTNFGHMLSMSEAILGQLYLVTAVSLVVANLGRQAATRPPEAR
jgi:hypothetical protein